MILYQIGLFDLSTWGSGVCHTYNPPKEVEPGVSGQFYAILGKENFFINEVKYSFLCSAG